MVTALNHYLEMVRENLKLDRSTEREVIHELATHIEDELQELKDAGLSDEEAARACLTLMGSAKTVARQIYESHSQGSWTQALFAAMPHLLFGLLFALSWWQGIIGLLAVLVAVLGVVVYGWWRGKPSWLFSWLGYYLVPVVFAGLLLLYLPQGWDWIAILIYIPMSLWLVCSFTLKTIKRDWVYSSLMLLPLPIIIGWFLAVEPVDRVPAYWLQRLQEFAPWIGLTFLSLGVAVTTFIRLRKRWLRISVLVISGLITLTMIAYYTQGRISGPAFLALIVVMLILLLSPALVERTLKHTG
ncbi:MAG TPA: permease prefix domain 1-containing protein [Dehalococcoidales bacterium]|nr:permease prefix domain 1-containing protein [Dehalococcoidales bacterium]